MPSPVLTVYGPTALQLFKTGARNIVCLRSSDNSDLTSMVARLVSGSVPLADSAVAAAATTLHWITAELHRLVVHDKALSETKHDIVYTDVVFIYRWYRDLLSDTSKLVGIKEQIAPFIVDFSLPAFNLMNLAFADDNQSPHPFPLFSNDNPTCERQISRNFKVGHFARGSSSWKTTSCVFRSHPLLVECVEAIQQEFTAKAFFEQHHRFIPTAGQMRVEKEIKLGYDRLQVLAAYNGMEDQMAQGEDMDLHARHFMGQAVDLKLLVGNQTNKESHLMRIAQAAAQRCSLALPQAYARQDNPKGFASHYYPSADFVADWAGGIGIGLYADHVHIDFRKESKFWVGPRGGGEANLTTPQFEQRIGRWLRESTRPVINGLPDCTVQQVTGDMLYPKDTTAVEMCGHADGLVTENTARAFNRLVRFDAPNVDVNPQNKGTGLMTPRAHRKLTMLAKMAAAELPGTRLR